MVATTATRIRFLGALLAMTYAGCESSAYVGQTGGDAAADGDTAECESNCSVGAEIRCSGTLIESCTLIDDRCLMWVERTNCAGQGMWCEDGAEGPACTCDVCPAGETRCNGEVIETCAVGADGCLGWVETEDCSAQNLSCKDTEEGTPRCTCNLGPGNWDMCGDVCVDIRGSDSRNCGECGFVCTAGIPGLCESGRCRCGGVAGVLCEVGDFCALTSFPHGTWICRHCTGTDVRCPGIYGCRDLQRDITSCGACGNACAAGEECREGECVRP